VVDEADITHHIHSALLPHPEVNIRKRATLRDTLEAKRNIGMHIKEKYDLTTRAVFTSTYIT
jgi:hypothetical protein